jgi:hypothetical protein
MRCDKSPAEIFTAAELISATGRNDATQSTSRPRARKIKSIPPTPKQFQGGAPKFLQFWHDGTTDQIVSPDGSHRQRSPEIRFSVIAETPVDTPCKSRAAPASTKPHDQNQAIPDLQPPLDGFENFHSMQ